MKLHVKRIIFTALVCLGMFIAIFMRWPIHFQTDLNSLMDIGGSDKWPIQRIVDKYSSVINIVVQSPDRFKAEQVAYEMRDMVNSNDFPEIQTMVNNVSPRVMISTLGKYHNVMLGTEYRKLLAEKKFADITNKARLRIESSVAPNMLPLSQDPFLLFTDYLSEIGNMGTSWIVQNGVLWQYSAPDNFYMVPVVVDALDNESLGHIVKKLDSRIRELETDEVQVYMGGAPVHTAQMYHNSKVELGIISFLALFAVIILNYLLCRRIRTIIPVAISLVVGYLVGAIALFLCFGNPHILVFVFGTSLIGLGVDYAFHAMYVSKKSDINVVHKNILYSLSTTVLCFAPLLFADVKLLQQIAVFTIAGLVAIYAFIKLFVNYRINDSIPRGKFILPINFKHLSYVLFGIAFVSVIACFFARMENNIVAMYRPDDKLAAVEKIIGELNKSDKSAFLIVRGHDIQNVLETEENLRDSGVQFFGLSSIIPSLKRQDENQNRVKSLYASQSKQIQRALGLKIPPVFKSTPNLTIQNNDIEDISKQLQKFIFHTPKFVYSISSVSSNVAIEYPNAKLVVPSQQIQTRIEQYSHETYNLLIICGIILVFFLWWLYRGQALKYLMPPLLGVIVPVGLLTIFGISITFFHLLGLFIVVGLGIDYAIFHINAKDSADLRPVFYSFLTSFIGFGLLAFTSFFLIASLGTVLAIGIAVSYLSSLYLFRN